MSTDQYSDVKSAVFVGTGWSECLCLSAQLDFLQTLPESQDFNLEKEAEGSPSCSIQ